MSEKNTWYEAYSHTGVELPEVKWNTSYRPRVEKPVIQPQAIPTLSPAEIHACVQSFVNGSEAEMEKAAVVLTAGKPYEAFNMLFQVANGTKTKDIERRKAAILTIAHMVDPGTAQAAAQSILNVPKDVELNAAICMALGIIGHPVGLPHLNKILKDGISIAVFNKNSVEAQKAFAFHTRAYALVALAMIGARDSIATLLLDVEREFIIQDYSDDANNIISNSSNIGLAILGTAASMYGNKRKNARVAAAMVDPDVGLGNVIGFPAETKRAWMLQLRVKVLKSLCSKHGIEPLKTLIPQAKHSIQRLFISLPITQLGNIDSMFIRPITESTRSSGRIERLLAYDGLVKIYSSSMNPQLESWALAGLNDRDSIVQAATAASLLYNKAGKLMTNALALTQAKSVDTRMTVTIPLMSLAVQGESFALEALSRIEKTEPDKNLREFVIDFMKDLPEAQAMYDLESGKYVVEEEEPSPQPVPEPSKPSWSTFKQQEYTSTPSSSANAGSNPTGASPATLNPYTTVNMIKCSYCHKEIPQNVQECPYCLTPNWQYKKNKPDEIKKPQVNAPAEDDYEFTCDECGAVVREDATVCPKCGASFDEDEPEYRCIDCDAVIPGTAPSCPKCGAEFACAECGESAPLNATSCPGCGVSFDRDEEE